MNPHLPTSDHEPDDLDRLFASTPPPPPPADVGGRARARLRAIRQARWLTVLALVDVAAVGALALLAFLFGVALAGSGVIGLAQLALDDQMLAVQARSDLATAFTREMPWLHVSALALDALLLVVLTQRLLRATEAVLAPSTGTRR